MNGPLEVSYKKRTNEFYFTTMKPQVDLFSFVFRRKLKTPKKHFEIIWALDVLWMIWNYLYSQVYEWISLSHCLYRFLDDQKNTRI